MFKKLAAIVVSAALLVTGATIMAPAASANVIDGMTFSLSGSNATVTDYDNTATKDVVIPAQITVSGTVYNVTTIGDFAFIGKQLTSVTIPNSVTTIGALAFSNNLLTSVTIGNSVTTISVDAFSNNLLTSVTIPNSVTTIGADAFYGNRLSSVVIPTSVTTIGVNVFAANQLTSVIIPNSVTTIGVNAFRSNQLTSVCVPNPTAVIAASAFDSGVTRVCAPATAPTGVTSIRAYARNGRAVVMWRAPVGVTVTGYIVTATPVTPSGSSLTGVSTSRRSVIIRGLTKGASYNFTVKGVVSPGVFTDPSISDSFTVQ